MWGILKNGIHTYANISLSERHCRFLHSISIPPNTLQIWVEVFTFRGNSLVKYHKKLKGKKNLQLLCHVTPLAVGITRIEPASTLPCAALIPIMATALDLTLHI
jgi:hypothetical protein